MIDALPRRERVKLLERCALDHREDGTLRLYAAERLTDLDASAGKGVLNRLADDGRLASSVRTRARLLADR